MQQTRCLQTPLGKRECGKHGAFQHHEGRSTYEKQANPSASIALTGYPGGEPWARHVGYSPG